MFVLEDRVYRWVYPSGAPDLEAFLGSRAAGEFQRDGSLVGSRVLGEDEKRSVLGAEFAGTPAEEEPALIVEHEKVPFPSYPYEWPPQMLAEAGRLTLDLAEAALREGLGLKDATPYNVLFRGADPVFIDLLSFEGRDPGDPTWLPYAQFARTFLLPLLAHRHFGVPLDQIFLTRRDGLSPEEVYGYCGPARRVRPPFLSLVSIPTWLAAREKADGAPAAPRRSADPERARFVVGYLLKQLRKDLDRFRSKGRERSVWSGYKDCTHYSREQFGTKEVFVREVVEALRPRRVMDIGCNTGHFSEIAARGGAGVVAVDADPVVVGLTWERARERGLPILPLVVNLARPTPAVGWANEECPSFLARAAGRFDLLLMLALIHHLIVSERVPLGEVLRIAHALTTDSVVIEYVPPGDPMFRKIARGRDALHKDLTVESFEAACSRYFEVVRCLPLEEGGRRLYWLRKVAAD